jgi:hypothetical protein
MHPKGRRVVIGNIHVLFNPKRGDIKLGQVNDLRNMIYNSTAKNFTSRALSFSKYLFVFLISYALEHYTKLSDIS